jgi:ubiquinone/menaquinone biosynthesis C-methylase UbiE
MKMFERMKAWMELVKLLKTVSPSTIRKEAYTFYRYHVIQSLLKEGWFNFFDKPKTMKDLAAKYNYTDMGYLQTLLEYLVEDQTLAKTDNGSYQTIRPINQEYVLLRLYDDSMDEIFKSYADAIPERLRGKYHEFSSGFNLFSWDNALALAFYECFRRSTFAFSGALKKRGTLLDVGCGNGFGTSAIWSYYLKRKRFENGNDMKIYGLDIDQDLLTIAEEEFPKMVEINTRINARKVAKEYSHCFPQFDEGSAIDLPYEDDTFDVVHQQQVIHWTNPQEALKEMIRVTKPGGMVMGAESFLRNSASIWFDACVQVVEGAHGFFEKKDLVQWAKEAGARKVLVATPISVFRIIK